MPRTNKAAATGLDRAAFVNLLRSQLGYHEGRDPGGNWNNLQKYSEQTPGLEWSDGQPWCAVFEAWGAHQLHADAVWPMTASCLVAVDWWKRENRWTDYPVLGGPFYLGTDGGAHTGVVVAYDADTITTIEGNTNNNGSYQGDGVYTHTRPRRGPGSPYGYGVPEFSEPTISADPALGGTAQASVAAPTPPAPKPTPQPGRPHVSLAHVVAAATTDPGAAQGHQTYPADVRPVEQALQAEGLLPAAYAGDGSFGSMTVTAYAKWQRRCGYNGAAADGIPGHDSLTRLGAKHGFDVTT